jgi:hypothetical protein
MNSNIASTLGAAGFDYNPFVVVPPNEMDRVVWAGDDSKIEELIEASYSPAHGNLRNSELLVVIGDYGAGKTNALKYLAKRMNERGDLAGYLLSVNVSDKPMWRDVVRTIFTRVWTRRSFVERLSSFRQYMQVESSRRGAMAVGENALLRPDEVADETAKAFEILCSEIEPNDPGFVKFVVDLADPSDSGKSQRCWEYFTQTKISPAEGSKFNSDYGLSPDGLSNDYNATKVLAGLIRLVTKETEFGIGSNVVALLIDEVEGWADLPNVSRSSILKGVRDLFAESTEYTSIVLAATSSDAAEMYGILDNALMMRLSRRPVEIPQMEPAAAKRFLVDLMGQNRIDGDFDENWPFTPDGIESLVNEMPDGITARKLVISASRMAFQKYKVLVEAGQGIGPDEVMSFDDWVY